MSSNSRACKPLIPCACERRAWRALSRLGYMEYGVLQPENVFKMPRPLASADERLTVPPLSQWDGVSR